MEPPFADPSLLLQLVQMKMPFGKYKDRLLCDLPVSYLEWFQRKGFPKGRLGMLLQTMYEIQLNGLGELLTPLKKKQMKDYKKYYILPAPPEELYVALTNPATIQLWSGEPAIMSTELGSEFSLWDDSISGKNIEFVEGKKIVQQWHFGDEEEEETTASIVTIKLHAHEQGTSVELRHTNIPDEAYDDIVDGWNDVYFASLQEFYDA